MYRLKKQKILSVQAMQIKWDIYFYVRIFQVRIDWYFILVTCILQLNASYIYEEIIISLSIKAWFWTILNVKALGMIARLKDQKWSDYLDNNRNTNIDLQSHHVALW